MKDKPQDRTMWAMGGGVMFGLGIGMFFLPASPLAFVGSLIAGIGLGLMVTAAISRKAEGGHDET
ncbi:hypothetical protein [Aliagarivorans marinus]|uniref:hypothetical protein n=1 Tax=Aliagarivorans marinus TaxID=561965 RepID=UPI0004789334|nr:hypothetical protein [Aliagarivorans marinus]